jgi:nicotinamide mononucleotide transporter
VSAPHWLAVDLVGVPLNFHGGLPSSGLVDIIYFVLVTAGMYAWWQQTLRAVSAPQPQLQAQLSTTVAEGVTA